MEIVEPGIVKVSEWRPVSAAEAATPSALWCGVGRKIQAVSARSSGAAASR